MIGNFNVTQTISRKVVSVYDYEDSLNESKRTIKLVKKEYAPYFQKQFYDLMSK